MSPLRFALMFVLFMIGIGAGVESMTVNQIRGVPKVNPRVCISLSYLERFFILSGS